MPADPIDIELDELIFIASELLGIGEGAVRVMADIDRLDSARCAPDAGLDDVDLDAGETDTTFRAVAADEMSEEDFTEWVAARISSAS